MLAIKAFLSNSSGWKWFKITINGSGLGATHRCLNLPGLVLLGYGKGPEYVKMANCHQARRIDTMSPSMNVGLCGNDTGHPLTKYANRATPNIFTGSRQTYMNELC